MIFNIKTECLWETALLYKAGLVIPSEWGRDHSEGFFCSTIVEVQRFFLIKWEDDSLIQERMVDNNVI